MNSIRKTLLAGVALAATSVGAQAADLYGGGRGGLKDYGYAPVTASPSWYVRLDGGYSSFDEPDLMHSRTTAYLTGPSIDSAWSVGGGIGTYFSQNVRGDITVDRRFESDVTGYSGTSLARFGLESTVALANVYYDFDTRTRFTPYLGVGLGVAFTSHKRGHAHELRLHRHHRWRGLVERGGRADGRVLVRTARALRLRRRLPLPAHQRRPYRRIMSSGVDTGSIRLEGLNAHEFRFGLRYDIR